MQPPTCVAWHVFWNTFCAVNKAAECGIKHIIYCHDLLIIRTFTNLPTYFLYCCEQ